MWPATTAYNSFNHFTGRPRFHFDEPPPVAPPPAAPPPAWHASLDAEHLGHLQNKGLDLADPAKVAIEMTKQHRAAERHFGVPVDRLVKMPAPDAKPEDIRSYYERLGAPKEAKDYDLSPIKDAAVADNLRAAMHDRGLPKDSASAIAAAVAKSLENMTTANNTELTAKLAAQKEALKANWGDKFAYNHLQAIEGARKLGIDPEAVAALEGVVGYDKVMEAMRKIGANTREDTFVEGGSGGQGSVTTQAGAVARKSELMADKGWTDRYLAGGVAEKREMDQLNKMIVGA